MRITFDVTSAVKSEPTGIGNYVVDLITAMHQVAPTVHFSMGVRLKKYFKREYVVRRFKSKRVTVLPLVPPVYSLLAGRIDLFHALGVRLPYYGEFKKVVTIHDLNTIENPEFTRPDWAKNRAARIEETINRADAIVTPSEFTRQRILSRFAYPEEWIRTVFHGVDLDLYSRKDPEKVAAFTKKVGLDRPYLLHVGAYVPRKNKIGLVRAFAQSYARKEGLLVLAGSKRGTYAEVAAEVEKLGIQDAVRYLGYVEREEVALLMQGARVFAFPSFYEGFGLPVLEAMAIGTPVMAAHASCLPEVGGDTVEYFDPKSVESMVSSLNRLWEDETRRSVLTKKAIERAKEFTWQRAAKATLALYQEVLH